MSTNLAHLNRARRLSQSGRPRITRGFRRPQRVGGLILLFCVLLFLASSPPAYASENTPVRLILALDTSGSMKTNAPLHLLPKAATLMVNLLEEQDCLGMLRFDESPSLMLEPGPLTSPRRRRGLRELARLAPRGPYTDIPAALDEALEAFGPPTSSPRALILITDGQIDIDPREGDSAAREKRLRQEIIPAYKKANIAIFPVAFTPSSNQTLLQELAAGTLGSFLLVEKPSDLHQAFLWLYEKLKQPQLAPIIDNRFCIDPGVEEAVLIASREAADRPVGLTDPLGRKLTPKDSPRQVRWFASPAFDMVTIPQPLPGFWTLRDFKAGQGKVVLFTDLTLVCPHVPEEVGEDEELLLGAALSEHGQPVSHDELLGHAVFHAILTPVRGEPLLAELEAPPTDQRQYWPAREPG